MSWSCHGILAPLQKENSLNIRKTPDRKCIPKNYFSTHLLQLGDIGNVVVSSLPLLLLELDGDASNGAPLETLHQVSDEPGNLILNGLKSRYFEK